MYKKITGVPENQEEARSAIILNRAMFKSYTTQLKEKKVEY